MLLNRVSLNSKFEKFAKNFLSKILKICFTLFFRIGTQNLCASFRKNRTKLSSNLKPGSPIGPESYAPGVKF